MPRPECTQPDRSRTGRPVPRHFDTVLGSLRSAVVARYGDAVYRENADIFAYAARTIARNWRRSAWRRRAMVRMWVEGLPVLFGLKEGAR